MWRHRRSSLVTAHAARQTTMKTTSALTCRICRRLRLAAHRGGCRRGRGTAAVTRRDPPACRPTVLRRRRRHRLPKRLHKPSSSMRAAHWPGTPFPSCCRAPLRRVQPGFGSWTKTSSNPSCSLTKGAEQVEVMAVAAMDGTDGDDKLQPRFFVPPLFTRSVFFGNSFFFLPASFLAYVYDGGNHV